MNKRRYGLKRRERKNKKYQINCYFKNKIYKRKKKILVKNILLLNKKMKSQLNKLSLQKKKLI